MLPTGSGEGAGVIARRRAENPESGLAKMWVSGQFALTPDLEFSFLDCVRTIKSLNFLRGAVIVFRYLPGFI